jgi:Zn-dependent protease with chaperone function
VNQFTWTPVGEPPPTPVPPPLFGDITGSGAVIFASRTLVTSSHSREAETAADTFSIEMMQKLGRPPKAMGELMLRVTGKEGGRPHDHLDPSVDRGSSGADEQGRPDA